MTKADIVNKVSEKLNVPKGDAFHLVESTFDLFKDGLIETSMVKFPGFGNFYIKSKAPRTGRNPQTGELIGITARKVLLFKPSEKLRAGLNGEAALATIR